MSTTVPAAYLSQIDRDREAVELLHRLAAAANDPGGRGVRLGQAQAIVDRSRPCDPERLDRLRNLVASLDKPRPSRRSSIEPTAPHMALTASAVKTIRTEGIGQAVAPGFAAELDVATLEHVYDDQLARAAEALVWAAHCRDLIDARRLVAASRTIAEHGEALGLNQPAAQLRAVAARWAT